MAIPTDPCLLAAWLKEIYFGAVTGSQETLIRSRGADSEQEVRYNRMDLATLRLELQRAEDDCRAQQGLPPLVRRFAVTAGSRRLLPPPRA
jgi:hypothetical protein